MPVARTRIKPSSRRRSRIPSATQRSSRRTRKETKMAEHRSPNGQVQYLGTGRRKCAVARVFLRLGEGKITINGRSAEDYFPTPGQRLRILQPLQATETSGKFDLLILAHGGGMNGQADAIRMGGRTGLAGIQPGAASDSQEAGLSETRPSQARAQEVWASGRAEAFPILEAVMEVTPGCTIGARRRIRSEAREPNFRLGGFRAKEDTCLKSR